MVQMRSRAKTCCVFGKWRSEVFQTAHLKKSDLWKMCPGMSYALTKDFLKVPLYKANRQFYNRIFIIDLYYTIDMYFCSIKYYITR